MESMTTREHNNTAETTMGYYTGLADYDERNVVNAYSEAITVQADSFASAETLIRRYAQKRGKVTTVRCVKKGF